jgi:hypothetical protein
MGDMGMSANTGSIVARQPSWLSRFGSALKSSYLFFFGGGDKAERAGRAWKRALWAVLFLGGTIPLVFYAGSQPEPLPVLGGGVLTALAAAIAGAFMGLIFGMPRATSRADSQSQLGQASAGVRPNTNLEDVSDWLTKILVGVGLTQLSAITGEFGRLVDAARGAISSNPEPGTVVGALILTYAGTGFLITYLFARTDLEAAVCAADASTVVFHNEVLKARELAKLHADGVLSDDDYHNRIGQLRLA